MGTKRRRALKEGENSNMEDHPCPSSLTPPGVHFRAVAPPRDTHRPHRMFAFAFYPSFVPGDFG